MPMGASQDSLRALLLTYAWPPTGGVGVARVLKLAKYLPDHGVTPAVLTVSNPSVPLQDPSLARDIRPGLEVLRAPTLEPGYGVKSAAWRADSLQAPNDLASRLKASALKMARNVLIPDPQVLWQPGVALALARRLRDPRADDLLFITAPPFSSFLAGLVTRVRPKTAIVLDYRDEWSTLRESYEMIGRINLLAGPPLERALLAVADAVTVATDAFRERLLKRFKLLSPEIVTTIPNGYDPDDFPAGLPEPPTDRFVMTYAGTVYKLTRPGGLLHAVRLLHERSPALAAKLRVRFIGRIVDTEAHAFDGMERFGVERTGFLPKDQVIPALASSHVTLVIQPREPGCERIYPAKMFELMYLGRPVLILSPEGAATQLVGTHRLGTVLPPDDPAAIATYLAAQLTAFSEGRFTTKTAPINIEPFHRRSLAGQFAKVFHSAVEHASRRGA